MSSSDDDKHGDGTQGADASRGEGTAAPAAVQPDRGPESKKAEEQVIAPASVTIEVAAPKSVSIPPPLPPSQRTPVIASPSQAAEALSPPPPAPGSKSRFVLLAVAVLACAGIAGAFLRFKTSQVQVVSGPKEPATARPSKAPVVEVPPEVTNTTDPAACIESHFPPETFNPSPKLNFVCSEPDAWVVTTELQKAIAARGATTGAALWGSLGLFELAAVNTLRLDCCTSVSPLAAPVPKTPCDSLAEALGKLGANPTASQLDEYEKVMRCLMERKVRFPPHYEQIADKPMREAVGQFFLTSSTGGAGGAATGVAGAGGAAGAVAGAGGGGAGGSLGAPRSATAGTTGLP